MSFLGFQIRSTTVAKRPPPLPIEQSKPTVHVFTLKDESQKKIIYIALYALRPNETPRRIAKTGSPGSEFGYITMNHAKPGIAYRLDYSRTYEEYGTHDMDLNFTLSTKPEKGEIESRGIRLSKDKGGRRNIEITITDTGVKLKA